MNDYRAAGQELPGQVLAAARKGQERVTRSVRNVTTAAQQLRPQLANLPRPAFSVSALPSPSQLREKAPDFVANLPARLQPMLPNRVQTRLPSPEQLRTSAQEFAGHARSVQRLVADQVRSVATPLAQQAAARLAQVGAPAQAARKAESQGKPGTTTKVSQVTVTGASKPASRPADKPADKPASKPADKPASKPSATSKTTRSGSTAKTSQARTSQPRPGTAKPKTGPADK